MFLFLAELLKSNGSIIPTPNTNILHLLIGIPYGLVYSPRYFAQLNIYMSSYYLGYYIVATSFL